MERQLPYVVECNWGRYFEPIAAFDCWRAARAYKDNCEEAAAGNGITYRVRIIEPEGDR